MQTSRCFFKKEDTFKSNVDMPVWRRRMFTSDVVVSSSDVHPQRLWSGADSGSGKGGWADSLSHQQESKPRSLTISFMNCRCGVFFQFPNQAEGHRDNSLNSRGCPGGPLFPTSQRLSFCPARRGSILTCTGIDQALFSKNSSAWNPL